MYEEFYDYDADDLVLLLKKNILVPDCTRAYQIITKKESNVDMKLYFASKILLLKGVLKLVDLKLLPVKENCVLDFDKKRLKTSYKVLSKIESTLHRRKLRKMVYSIPFDGYLRAHKDVYEYYFSDRLDGILKDIAFPVGYHIPLDIIYTAMELSIWRFFSKNRESIKNLLTCDKKIVEFTTKTVARHALNIYNKLVNFGFKPPTNLDFILSKYYDYVIMPAMYLNNGHGIPDEKCIAFYVYSGWDRIGSMTRNLRKEYIKNVEDELRDFYQSYYRRFQ